MKNLADFQHHQKDSRSKHSSRPTLIIILLLSLSIVPVLPLRAAHAVTATSQLTIKTVDTNRNPIYGFFTVLNQSNTIVATGFTTAAFTLNNGQTYTVQVDNYGSCHINNWADTGDTLVYRTVSITADTSYTAVMYCGE